MGKTQQSQKPKANFIGIDGNTFGLHGEPIENEIAKCMIKKFRDTHPNQSGKPRQTLSVRLSRQDLLDLLSMMEKPNGLGIKPDGVNAHFARYSEDNDINTVPTGKDYKGRDTIVFVMSISGVDVIDLTTINCIPPKDPTTGGSDAYDHNELNP